MIYPYRVQRTIISPQPRKTIRMLNLSANKTIVNTKNYSNRSTNRENRWISNRSTVNNSKTYKISMNDRKDSYDSSNSIVNEIKNDIMSSENSKKTNEKIYGIIKSKILLPIVEKKNKPKPKISTSNLLSLTFTFR